ncbi:hypothetical protein AAHE18_10G135800 [Arachis hypogaea]
MKTKAANVSSKAKNAPPSYAVKMQSVRTGIDVVTIDNITKKNGAKKPHEASRLLKARRLDFERGDEPDPECDKRGPDVGTKSIVVGGIKLGYMTTEDFAMELFGMFSDEVDSELGCGHVDG